MVDKIEDNYLKKELYELIKTDESIFDFIQEGSLDGLWYWDLENPENEWMNAKFWKVLGYDPDKMPHKSSAWQHIINQEDLKVANENFTKHCENPNHPYDQVVRYTHKDGSTVWIRCRGLAIRDKNGKPIRMLGAHQDISDTKRSEQELSKAKEKAEESELRYRRLFENMNTGFVLFEVVQDKQGIPVDLIILNANDAFEKTTGLNLKNAVGMHLTKVLPDIEKDDADWIGTYSKVALSGEPIRFEQHSELLGYYYNVSAFKAGPKQCAVTFMDITERKRAEEALKATNQELKKEKIFSEKIVETTDAIIVGLDKDHIIKIFNRGAEQITGYKKDEVIGKDWFKIFFPKEMLDEMNKVWEEAWGVKSHSYINPILAKSGVERIISWQVTGMYDSDDVPKHLVLSIGEDITERKQAEEKNIEMRGRFERISLHLPGVIYQFRLRPDGTFHFPYASPGIYDIYGVNPEEVEHDATAAFSAIHPDDLEQVRASINHSAETLTRWHEIYRLNHTRGETIWVEGQSTPQILDDGSIIWHGYIQDITERKQAENQLRMQLTMLNAVGQAVIGTNREGIITYFNQTAEELYGWPKTEAIGQNILDVTVPQTSKLQAQEIMEALTASQNWSGEFLVQNRAGKMFPAFVHNSPVIDDKGKLIGIIGLSEDISDRKKLEERLKLFNRAIEASSVSIVITDAEGKIDYVNPYFTEVTGYSFDEVHGGNPRIFNSGKQSKAFYEDLWRTIKSGNIWTGQFNNAKKNGDLFWEKAIISPILNDDSGEITHFVAIKEDITKLLEKEDELKQSLKEKEIMLAEVHHRVKNNLAVVSAMLHLQSFDEKNTEVQERLLASTSRIKTIANIHENLYQNESFSRIDFSENIRMLAQNIVKIYNVGKQIKVDLSLEQVQLNINQAVPFSLIINEVLINAFVHAFIKEKAGNISVYLSEQVDQVQLKITDNGIGLPDDFREKSHSSGSKIIQVLTDQLGGKHQYKRVNTGTEFTLTFEKKETRGSSSAIL